MGARTAIGGFEWVLPAAELTHQLRRPAGLSLSDCWRTAPGLPLVACKPQLHCQPLTPPTPSAIMVPPFRELPYLPHPYPSTNS